MDIDLDEVIKKGRFKSIEFDYGVMKLIYVKNEPLKKYFILKDIARGFQLYNQKIDINVLYN